MQWSLIQNSEPAWASSAHSWKRINLGKERLIRKCALLTVHITTKSWQLLKEKGLCYCRSNLSVNSCQKPQRLPPQHTHPHYMCLSGQICTSAQRSKLLPQSSPGFFCFSDWCKKKKKNRKRGISPSRLLSCLPGSSLPGGSCFYGRLDSIPQLPVLDF